MVADALSTHYTVATYDRRGFSRSHLTGTQDEARRLETDADDARRLIAHLSDEPAIVFGSSSGGIVALEVLTRHPSVVRTLIAFEPPAMRLLPDGQQWVDFFFQVYDIYRKAGIEPALARFREHAFAVSDRQIMAQATTRKDPKTWRADTTYWLERELRHYPAVALDRAALTAHTDQVVPAVGEESRGYPCYEVTVALGTQLGRNVLELPGGHVGYVAHPAEFARVLHDALSRGGNASAHELVTFAANVLTSSSLRIMMRGTWNGSSAPIWAASPPSPKAPMIPVACAA
jgi:pimeloyl-ACP methyl ester carboxylesterase